MRIKRNAIYAEIKFQIYFNFPRLFLSFSIIIFMKEKK